MDWGMLANRLTEGNALYVLLGVSAFVAVTAIKSLADVLKSRSRERTRREIAAYIAEGSMSPEQGEKLMRAGDRRTEA